MRIVSGLVPIDCLTSELWIISNGGGDGQFDLGSGVDHGSGSMLTPDFQLPAKILGAFAHTGQAPMPRGGRPDWFRPKSNGLVCCLPVRHALRKLRNEKAFERRLVVTRTRLLAERTPAECQRWSNYTRVTNQLPDLIPDRFSEDENPDHPHWN